MASVPKPVPQAPIARSSRAGTKHATRAGRAGSGRPGRRGSTCTGRTRDATERLDVTLRVRATPGSYQDSAGLRKCTGASRMPGGVTCRGAADRVREKLTRHGFRAQAHRRLLGGWGASVEASPRAGQPRGEGIITAVVGVSNGRRLRDRWFSRPSRALSSCSGRPLPSGLLLPRVQLRGSLLPLLRCLLGCLACGLLGRLGLHGLLRSFLCSFLCGFLFRSHIAS